MRQVTFTSISHQPASIELWGDWLENICSGGNADYWFIRRFADSAEEFLNTSVGDWSVKPITCLH